MFRTILLPLSIACALAAHGMDARALAQAGNDAYAKGDYAAALADYDSANATMTSASLLYNIGNCHIKLGDVPHAILYYERALRLQPGAEDIQANLDLARSRIVDRVNDLPGFTLGSLWDRLRSGSDVHQWTRRSLWACLALFLLLGAAVAVRVRSAKRGLYVGAAITLVFMITSIILAWYRTSEVHDRSQAIIMQPKVDVLGEPREGATTLFVLHQGTKVGVAERRQNGWYEVKLANGSVGWAPPASLVII